MLLYSTKNPSSRYSLEMAVMRSLPADNGLFMPKKIPRFSPSEMAKLLNLSFSDLSKVVALRLMEGGLPSKVLMDIVDSAIDFPAPLVSLDAQMHILELFHGPTLAFKDFGARFMSRLMMYFNRDENQELTILVATSGDTGGAVAAGFHNTPGIRVVILYPSGKVSAIQEQQLTTLGGNIHAIEINGTFDDCQALVKQAFLDSTLQQQLRLSSANSINIARLIPQSFYYFEGYKQIVDKENPVCFVVPSGNFGNLMAGLIAQRMGLPVHHFVAATNVNDVVPEYLTTGTYTPRTSERTLSNAMDVGNPSNFARMIDLCSTWNNMRSLISGYKVSDKETEATLRFVADRHKYILDPHGAVGYRAAKNYLATNPTHQTIVLETAHPAKFIEDVVQILKENIEIPISLQLLAVKKKEATYLQNNYSDFKDWLLAL